MRYILITIAIGFLFYTCTPEEERITTDPSVKLRFSTDTILFDTVFTSLGSVTRRFRVFNDNDKAVRISNISLGIGENSPYLLTVNGEQGRSFSDQVILGQDSMLILAEVTIDPQNKDLPFIVKDSIVFQTNMNQQDVKLISWGQDAHFLSDSILACNTTWTGGRPYVIFNSILVDSLCELRIEPGTRIFSHKNSAIFIQGSLIVEGTPEEKVIFRNDRLDEKFEVAPGQWDGIFFLEGSRNNRIDHAEIKNSEFGIWLGTPDEDTIPDLVLSNTVIENISNTGMICFTSDLFAYNVLIDNCVQFTLGNLAGGNYIYHHCTFANFSFDFFREQPAVVFADNFVRADNTVITGDLHVELQNSIIWGSMQDELLLSTNGSVEFNLNLNNNIIRTTIEGLENSNLINMDPLFIDPEMFNYKLESLSPAVDAGTNLGIASDLDGNSRDANPDLGAFERKD